MKRIMKRNYLAFGILLLLLDVSVLPIGCAQTSPTSSPQPTKTLTLTPIPPPAQTPATGNQSATPQPTATPAINVPSISVYDAYILIQKNKGNPNFVIIDVRTPDEFNSGHIENAINIDYESPDFVSNISKLDINKQYIVYCRTGVRGTAATLAMITLGFKNVQNLTGAILAWTAAGYPTVTY
jgi:rhodanese-related sulfurtransferase